MSVAVLARKIQRAKWDSKAELGVDAIAADAVTADLRTSANALSFWRCKTCSPDDLKPAFLALAAAADRPDRLELVCLDEQAITGAGLTTKDTPGQTPIATLRDCHVDIEGLDLERLAQVAKLVAAAHRSNAGHLLAKKEVVALLAEAIRGDLLRVEDLKDKMRSEVERIVTAAPPR